MASISVPCPKSSPVATPVAGPSRFPALQSPAPSRLSTFKAQVAVGSSSNSSVSTLTKSDALISNGSLDQAANQAAAPDSTISAFIAEVSNLIKLVDTKDIVELQLKNEQCELLIRKKEALPQPPVAAAPPMMMQYPQQMFSAQPSVSQNAASPEAKSPASISPPALPAPAKASSSHAVLKSPMAGTFYRKPGPGEAPFVKVGDKVNKGQVVCIIEAMKLMNEIEAEQSGTIVDILAEDAKPVSVDTPLFAIQP